MIETDRIKNALLNVNALAKTLGKDFARLRVHELVLQRRAACVDNENVHGCVNSCMISCFFFWRFVIVLTHTLLFYNRFPRVARAFLEIEGFL